MRRRSFGRTRAARPLSRRRSGTAALVLVLALLVAAVSAPAPHATAAAVNPLAARPLAVDPNSWAAWAAEREGVGSAAAQIAAVPQTRWITSSLATDEVRADVERYVSGAEAAGRLPTMTLYAIPHRDCGGYAAGGVEDRRTYAAWVGQVVAGIAGRPVAVVLEPDALAGLDCLPRAQQQDRYVMLGDAVRQLTVAPTTALYVDVGHSRWLPAPEAAGRLTAVGVGRARGFSLNVSNFLPTAEQVAYGEALSALLDGAHYVVDTSRNGLGPAPDAPLNWCNPAGRGLGARPTTSTAGRHADAYLWIKRPGESDGECERGDPRSGTWFDGYAQGLVARARPVLSDRRSNPWVDEKGPVRRYRRLAGDGRP